MTMTGNDIVDVAGVALLSGCWLVGYMNYRTSLPSSASLVFFLLATGALLFALLGILISNILSRSGHDGGTTVVDIVTGLAGVIVFLWFIAYGLLARKRRPGNF